VKSQDFDPVDVDYVDPNGYLPAALAAAKGAGTVLT
jgi:hypothetical protein